MSRGGGPILSGALVKSRTSGPSGLDGGEKAIGLPRQVRRERTVPGDGDAHVEGGSPDARAFGE